MTDIGALFTDAELALAAYADLLPGSLVDQRSRLEAAGMSASQAEEFARRYPTVVIQYNDTETSLSATVFKDTTGNLTLAIRGTLELVGSPSDLSTDTDIFLRGAGYDQIVALYNWWQRASTPIGQAAPQYAIQSFLVGAAPEGAVLLYMAGSGPNLDRGFYLVKSVSVAATGELVNDIANDSDNRLAVTGHSLGGHLAMAFGALFPDVAGQITAFNAPGFINSTTNQNFFSALGGAVPTGVNTTNVIADEAGVGDKPWDAIAGLHGELGTVIRVPIENQWGREMGTDLFVGFRINGSRLMPWIGRAISADYPLHDLRRGRDRQVVLAGSGDVARCLGALVGAVR